MNMNTMKKISDYVACISLMLAALGACAPEPLPMQFRDEEDGAETKTLALHLESADMVQSKSSLGGEIESLFTGAVLAVYDSETGALESEHEIPSEMLGKTMMVSVPQGRVYDLFLIGNLRLLGDDGTAVFPDVPSSSGDMEGFSYRLDGAETGEGLRRESFQDVADWGIPLCWSRRDVDPLVDTEIEISMERLFAKVVLTVDHSGIAGTDLESFINESVHIRQSNCLLLPFSAEGSRAEGEEDVISVSDYEASMKNGLLEEFVFYVPENRQGVLMPGNTDPYSKDIEGVEEACGNSGISALLTYLEFRGRLNAADQGLEGDILYRFFLGRNATDDFDIGRNTEIHVTLGFKSQSVFEPDWKLDSEGFSDSRRFFLSGDLAGVLPEGKEIYVRKNRPGTFNLNVTTTDGGPNIIGSAVLVDADHEPETMTELAWTSDFWSAGHEAADEPKRAELEALGIEVRYSAGCFTFSVTDPGRFVTGRRIPLTLRLMPGNIETTAVIVTSDDISVTETGGLRLDEGFFVGQKRSLAFSGFAGSKVYYLADQRCTEGYGGSEHDGNVQWKTSNKDSAPFVRCRVNSSGNVIYPYQDYGLYEDQSIPMTERLNVYAFFPNTYRVHPYLMVIGKIVICSDDIHNDGLTELPVRIDLPYYTFQYLLYTCTLPFDGKEIDMTIRYLTEMNGEEIAYSDFDPGLYDLLLSPEFSWSPSTEFGEWHECIEISDERGSIYLARTTLDGKKMEDHIQGREYVGSLKVKPNSHTGLYTKITDICTWMCYISVPYAKEVKCTLGTDYFDDDGTDGIIEYTADFQYDYGDPDYVEFSETGPVLTYRTVNSPSREIRPRTELFYEDGAVKYVFRESDQPTETSDGEMVPGSLLVPYGEHHVEMTVKNRWDGRTMVADADYLISYVVELCQFAICRPLRNATIYHVSRKNARYLAQYGATADWSTVEFLIGLLGGYEWGSHVSTAESYRFDNHYHQLGRKIYYEVEADFDVRYYRDGELRWTKQIMDDMLKEIADEENDIKWLDGLRFHVDGVIYDYRAYEVEMTGNPSLVLDLKPNIGGAVFRNKIIY